MYKHGGSVTTKQLTHSQFTTDSTSSKMLKHCNANNHHTISASLFDSQQDNSKFELPRPGSATKT